MAVAAAFLGMALASLMSAVGCIIVASMTPNLTVQFYAIAGAILSFAIGVGTAFAAWLIHADLL